MADLQALADSVIAGKRDDVAKMTQAAVDEGVSPADIINDGLIAGMAVVGEKFKNNEFYVPEVLIAARAMHAGMDIIKPLLAKSGVQPRGTVAIGTVKGDLHDIGKNLVAMMLEGGGYEVLDLEVDVPAEKFVDAVKSQGAGVVALSALLTTTMPAMKDTIDALKEAGVRDQVKVVIGGAPVTQNYADEIGADGYAPDAASAVDKVRELLG
ncbi:MAG: corrinoid protein [Armatimonadetes bacterium]|jgi:5-methyltetrahydrofolate--homocysteine methyltransferase|nr:corrinoid protein [Armatimonadota bacterium]MDI9585714.1 corrinoid protein [Acidobacteriota bacterium]